jgi:hypothetical protein
MPTNRYRGSFERESMLGYSSFRGVDTSPKPERRSAIQDKPRPKLYLVGGPNDPRNTGKD